ncbi:MULTISPECIES: rRNA maturation RNase YbeY [Vagococcus]|uniref:Endoribonuclease YbeY n=1 Tax=Vagococcus fluvialis bH819 TaxID=1255619 RepID=A0A1X6WQ09_9ENTE|nr:MULTISPECIES: rRNA maturation RNase YbeY [Vagococcus]SLM85736.1 Metal-dependent hydrolase YbeY, involved in rRNA and/or ribosome maturation and assembly [Vagococcus fluvialis bH819]HCM90158.1 rRNA maturation RNase YbeY [Vagococcus sp.]
MDITIVDKTKKITDTQLKLTSDIIEFASKESTLDLADDTEMSVTFVTNEEIHTINRQYRDKNAPTDVISFALEDEGIDELSVDFSEFGIPRNLGDIIVSVEKVAEQAAEFNHSFERELGFLVVHGFLHLNGFDHMTELDEKEMFGLQRKILDDYGLKR